KILPLHPGSDAGNPVLRKKISSDFTSPTSTSGVMPLEPLTPEKENQFRGRIHDLAIGMSKRLRELAATAPPPPDRPVIGTVLLAQVTEDLEDEREAVRRYLEDQNIGVLPKSPYPVGDKEFEAAYLADLAQASMVIQLLSKATGRVPRGYVAAQDRLA